MIDKKQSQQGFSLVEVIIAIAILSIGLITLISMQTTGIKGNATASQITVSSDWAADRIEQIYSWDFDDQRLWDDESITDTAPLPAPGAREGAAGLSDATDATADGRDVSPDGYYTIYWNIADELVMPNTKSIRIIVNRTDHLGIIRPTILNYTKSRFF